MVNNRPNFRWHNATSDIADDAVTAAKLAANAVVSGSIANGTIVTADLADNSINQVSR